MPGQRDVPFRNFKFRVEIDGIQQAGFSDVTGFDATIDVIDYREGTDPKHARKLSGLTKYGNVTLKWGVTDSMDLYQWFNAGTEGAVIRKNIAIVAIDEAGNDRARWEITNAWPTKYDPADFTAKGNDVAIETLEIVHEGVKRVS